MADIHWPKSGQILCGNYHSNTQSVERDITLQVAQKYIS